MEEVSNFLSENPHIKALANLSALITFGIFIFRVIKQKVEDFQIKKVKSQNKEKTDFPNFDKLTQIEFLSEIFRRLAQFFSICIAMLLANSFGYFYEKNYQGLTVFGAFLIFISIIQLHKISLICFHFSKYKKASRRVRKND